MKQALILHGTGGNSQDNWFPWLTEKLESDGYQVWCPNLPQADKPNIERYSQFILNNSDFKIDRNTILIGHSSGAVAILGLLETLPSNVKVKACYLVGSFKNDLGWDSLKELFLKPFDFDQVKQKSRLWYFIHSDNDPYCPLEQAEYLHQQIGGDLIILPGQKHFSVGTVGEKYRQFHYLYHLIAEDTATAEIVLDLYQHMEKAGVKIWIDGGWGVDALLGKQTRPHGDVDIEIQKNDLPVLLDYLKKRNYSQIRRSDTKPHNFLMGTDQAEFVDVHVIELDEQGNGMYGPKEDGVIFPAEALAGKGVINGITVNCISPEWVVKFHSGFELREKDHHDVKALCEKYGIELPEQFLAQKSI